ncbi:MAG: Prevent-host-death protein [Deltaproteobacteria bacterium]|nr:Prevent-host-death protein [Deltaproteobacteria bacterium]
MKTLSAGEFKTHCLRIMEDVRQRREAVVITKRGVPIAKLVPTDAPKHEVFGCMAGTAVIIGDIESPVLSSRAWKVSR